MTKTYNGQEFTVQELYNHSDRIHAISFKAFCNRLESKTEDKWMAPVAYDRKVAKIYSDDKYESVTLPAIMSMSDTLVSRSVVFKRLNDKAANWSIDDARTSRTRGKRKSTKEELRFAYGDSLLTAYEIAKLDNSINDSVCIKGRLLRNNGWTVDAARLIPTNGWSAEEKADEKAYFWALENDGEYFEEADTVSPEDRERFKKIMSVPQSMASKYVTYLTKCLEVGRSGSYLGSNDEVSLCLAN